MRRLGAEDALLNGRGCERYGIEWSAAADYSVPCKTTGPAGLYYSGIGSR